MRPLFSVHAGEFLVGNEIESRFPGAILWLPAKDTGVDLLVTNRDRSRSVSLQVKYSRNFADLHPGMTACSWFKLQRTKVLNSAADLWIFVLWSPTGRTERTHYVVIPPKELVKRLSKIHGHEDSIHSYFWVTGKRLCWEGRGLKRAEEILMAEGQYRNPLRDFTAHLDAWGLLGSRLGTRVGRVPKGV